MYEDWDHWHFERTPLQGKKAREIVLLKGARPLKANLYLVCLNNKCFDF